MSTASGPVDIPSSLSPYEMEICSVMGEGSLYRICKARHGTKYVILKCPVQSETIYIEMLRREYEIGYTLSHPCVVNILGFEENTEVGPALVMEYIDGVTLDEFMRTRPSRQQSRQVLGDILDGVDYLHKRGILHNDLKPSNIIITSSSRAKIIDFGFSSSEDSAYSGVRGGSDGYTAPEILSGERSILPASDIYSVGKIMKYMGLGPSSVIRRAVSEEPSRRFQCVGDLRKAVRKRRTLFLSAAMLTIAAVLMTLMLMRSSAKPEQLIAEHKESAASQRIEEAMIYIESQCRKALDDMYRYPYYEWAFVIRAEFLMNSKMYLNAMSFEDLCTMNDPVTSYADSLYSVMNSLPPASVLPREELEIFNERLTTRIDSLQVSWNQDVQGMRND